MLCIASRCIVLLHFALPCVTKTGKDILVLEEKKSKNYDSDPSCGRLRSSNLKIQKVLKFPRNSEQCETNPSFVPSKQPKIRIV